MVCSTPGSLGKCVGVGQVLMLHQEITKQNGLEPSMG